MPKSPRGAPPSPEPAPGQMPEQELWICSLCGAAHGTRITVRVKYFPIERKPYLETVDFDPLKPFGVIIRPLGRGKGSEVIRYLNPQESKYFPAVKRRFLAAIQEWLDKGWLKREEILEEGDKAR